jgi:D-alanine-D-alanine ligase
VKVAVLKGGRSLERQVSLRSGARVEDALASLGHEVVPYDVDAGLVKRLKEERPDVAFVALHGTDGEDGTVQELLEILDLPYTGPGVAACMRSMDKVATKQELRLRGIGTPDWVSFSSSAFGGLGAGDALEEIEAQLGFPLVVKPGRGGSALGVRFAASREDVPEAIVAALSYDDHVLLERHVDGVELSISVLDRESLPIVEVRPREEDLYSYEARYEIGRTEFICPADLSDDDAAAVAGAALGTWDALRCEGFARVDVMLGSDGPQVIEVNAIPGLTDTSLLPMAAEAAGLTFERLVERILALALARGAAPQPSNA